MNISNLFLRRTELRDKVIFPLFAVIITFFTFVTLFDASSINFNVITFLVVVFLQFIFAGFISIPVNHSLLRNFLFLLLFTVNFFLFRTISISLIPNGLVEELRLETSLVLLFLLTLVGRNIRIYISLIENLKKLNALRLRNQLFGKTDKVILHFGNEGKMTVHPNEIVYIRTKSAGDHTKIFGIKRRTDANTQSRLKEFETAAYQNFSDIFKELMPFPQFKRISQSVAVNFQYPYEERGGTLLIESRRFTISAKYSQVRK